MRIAFNFRPLAIFLVATLLFANGGCAPTPFNGQPIEQLTIRFNGDFMEHAGEYRLIRPLAQQNQCLWQLYADGQLTAVGQIPLPVDGLSAVFSQAAAGFLINKPTSRPDNGLTQAYVLHLTFDTPFDRQEAEFTGSLADISSIMQQAGELNAIHRSISKKIPPIYWFGRLEQSRTSD